RLARVAQQQLGRKLAARVDGEDVVQSVFRTFFRRQACGEFQLDSTAQLWRLLVKITLLKARARGRHHSAACRAVAAETAADDWSPDAVAHEPTPEEAATLNDLVEHVLDGLPPLYARILEMRLAGHSVTEMAPQLGLSRQTIYRALDLLQQRLAGAT